MTVNYTYNIPTYTANNVPRLVFTFNVSAIGMPATPYCRIDGNLCPVCTWSGG